MFTSDYVNTETILHFFYKITNERGTKNRVYIRSCKMVLWPIRVHVLFELFCNFLYSHHFSVWYCEDKVFLAHSQELKGNKAGIELIFL